VVFSESLEIELRDFHNNMKSDEMNDGCFNFSLEREKPAVDSFTIDSCQELEEPDYERNLRTTFNKTVCLVVCILHDVHSLHYLWVENEVQTNCTWKLNNKNGIAAGKPEAFVLLSEHHGVQHTRKHAVLKEKKHHTIKQIFAKNFGRQ
jgi:hypothetical protein